MKQQTSKGNRLARLIPLFLLLGTALHLSFAATDNRNFAITKSIDIFSSVMKELELYYVDTIDTEEMTTRAINTMLGSLDPYTSYYPEEERKEFEVMTTGEYGGIGSVIQQRDSFVIISDPYLNRPAQVAGLKAGDQLLQIDSISLRGKTTSEVSALLKGEPNTPLRITIQRPGEDSTQVKEVIRQKIVMEAVPYYGMLNDSVGYILLTTFSEKAAGEVTHALTQLKEQEGATSLVLDLRGNPGGLMDHAIEIVNLFVPKGELVLSTRGKVAKWDKEYFTTREPLAPDMPLTVLIDRGSASASEIVSGALQDLDRAVIVGERSFGKGLVQSTRPMAYNGMVKITTAKYYIPSGRSIQAIDYSHRNADGSVGRIPDSLTTAYNTAHGRIVRDGGGITPDVVLEPEEYNNISLYLLRDMLIFDFATRYAAKHPTIAPIEEFVVDDSIYTAFKEFVIEKEFTYDRQSEKALAELKEIAEFEGYLEAASEEFAALESLLKHADLNQDLDTFRNQIAHILGAEIAKRYYYQKGEIQQGLKEDKALKKAIETLANSDQYRALLAPIAQ